MLVSDLFHYVIFPTLHTPFLKYTSELPGQKHGTTHISVLLRQVPCPEERQPLGQELSAVEAEQTQWA